MPSTQGIPKTVERRKRGEESVVERMTGREGSTDKTRETTAADFWIGFLVFLIMGGGWGIWSAFKGSGNSASSNNSGETPTAVTANNPEEPEIKRATLALDHNLNPSPIGKPPQGRNAVVVGLSGGDTLNVRLAPASSSKTILKLSNGKKVIIIGKPVFNGETEWIPVQYRDRQGWINSAFLQPQPQ